MKTFEQWQDYIKRKGRGKVKVIVRGTTARDEGTHITFTCWDTTLARMTPDNVLTMLASIEEMGDMTTRFRMARITDSQTDFFSDKSRHGNKKSHIRFVSRALGVSYGNSLPYYPGLQLQAPQGTIINKEHLTEQVKTLDRVTAREIAKNMKDFSTAVRVYCAMNKERFGEVQHYRWQHWKNYQAAKERMLGKENFTEVNETDFDDVLLIGMQHTNSYRGWRYNSDSKVADYLTRVIDNGLRKVRAMHYEKNKLYSFTQETK